MRCQFTHLHSKCPLLCKGMVLKWKAVHGSKRTKKALHVSTRDPYCTSVGVNPIYENSRKIVYEKCKNLSVRFTFYELMWISETDQSYSSVIGWRYVSTGTSRVELEDWREDSRKSCDYFLRVGLNWRRGAVGIHGRSSSANTRVECLKMSLANKIKWFFHKSSDAIYFLMRIKRLHCGNALCDKINWWDV